MEGNNPLKLVLFLLDVGWWYSLVPDESCVCWSIICTSWYYKIWRSFGYFIIIVVIVKTIDFTAYYLFLFRCWFLYFVLLQVSTFPVFVCFWSSVVVSYTYCLIYQLLHWFLPMWSCECALIDDVFLRWIYF